MKQQTNNTRLKKILLLPNQKQSGFIQAVILFGIALIAAVIGAFALSGKGATKNTSPEEAKLAASTLIKQAGDLQEAIQRYRSDRGGFNGMTFSADANVGIFNTTDRFATQLIGPSKGYVIKVAPNAPSSLTTFKYGSWTLKKDLTINGIVGNWAVVTTGLSKDTCQRINNLIYGAVFPSSTPPPASGVAVTAWDTAPSGSVVTLTFAGTTAAPGIPAGATEGCLSTTTTATNPESGQLEPVHAYFKVVNEGGTL